MFQTKNTGLEPYPDPPCRCKKNHPDLYYRGNPELSDYYVKLKRCVKCPKGTGSKGGDSIFGGIQSCVMQSLVKLPWFNHPLLEYVLCYREIGA